jgi:hypothetical protein
MGSIVAACNVQAINRSKKGCLTMSSNGTVRFQFSPPHFKFETVRVDCPTSNRTDIYERDLTFFKSHQNRRLSLRLADKGEFDHAAMTLGEWLQVPQLHVLVTKLSTGVHLVVPVYRGKAFFREVASDAEVSLIVADMAKLEGIDLEEIARYEQSHPELIPATTVVRSETIH